MEQFLIDNMAPIMFGSLIVFLMFGYSVAFSLAACGLFFGFVGVELGVIQPAFLQSLPLRMFGIMQNDTLLAIPFFTFMGLILERSGLAEDLLDTAGRTPRRRRVAARGRRRRSSGGRLRGGLRALRVAAHPQRFSQGTPSPRGAAVYDARRRSRHGARPAGDRSSPHPRGRRARLRARVRADLSHGARPSLRLHMRAHYEALAKSECESQLARLRENPGLPAEPFRSDGCSWWPDGSFTGDGWQRCCILHDIAYWCGGSEPMRREADAALRECVAEEYAGWMGVVMQGGVRAGGTPWMPAYFRWGYGRPYPTRYFEQK